MISVYCDSGGFRKELKSLCDKGQISLVMFPYENVNKNIQDVGLPSKASWNDLKNFLWSSLPGTWADYQGSEKYTEIKKIIGKQHEEDVKHIDAAYKSGCQCLLTRDKGDILSKKGQLGSLLGMKIFHPDDEWKQFLAYINET